MRLLANIIRVIFGGPLVIAMICTVWPLLFLITGYDDANDATSELWSDYKGGF
jgi:hypothetical protein